MHVDKLIWCHVRSIQPTGGGFLVYRDEIHFYVTGRRPAISLADTYVDGKMEITVGIARLRRDGFASFSAPSAGGVVVVTSQPVVFSGSALWVNVKLPAAGSLRVELLDAVGAVLSPWGVANNTVLVGRLDETQVRVNWTTCGSQTLVAAAGKHVRLRFWLEGGAQLFSFWVSREDYGASGGYVGAGGPDYPMQRDSVRHTYAEVWKKDY